MQDLTAAEILDLPADEQPIWNRKTVGRVLAEHQMTPTDVLIFIAEVKVVDKQPDFYRWRSGEVLAWLGY
jgi:hypothetical protein